MGIGSLFTWWHGPGLGTRLVGWRTGREVGRDAQGNVYFVAKPGRRERRWVIYNGEPEASRIPPEWHLWLHKTVDDDAGRGAAEGARLGEAVGAQPDRHPGGAPAIGQPRGRRERGREATGDYQAWTPE